jgi:DNA-binding transcriptional ArsR family regulator
MSPIPRSEAVRLLRARLRLFPAVVLLGPRQCGKSTLARGIARGASATVFDLERLSDLRRLQTAPEEDLGSLQRRTGLIVIDEIQREPALLPLLRPLLDDRHRRARYLLLGSASPDLVRGASESLAGRAASVDLTPFLAVEVGRSSTRLMRLWSRGGFPRSFLARGERESLEWREAYLRALLERDVPALRPGLPVASLRSLLGMLAHVHGGLLNAAELGSGLGISGQTVARHLDVLEGLFMVRRLARTSPRRQATHQGPKGTCATASHALLDVADLDGHPKVGASWKASSSSRSRRPRPEVAETVLLADARRGRGGPPPGERPSAADRDRFRRARGDGDCSRHEGPRWTRACRSRGRPRSAPRSPCQRRSWPGPSASARRSCDPNATSGEPEGRRWPRPATAWSERLIEPAGGRWMIRRDSTEAIHASLGRRATRALRGPRSPRGWRDGRRFAGPSDPCGKRRRPACGTSRRCPTHGRCRCEEPDRGMRPGTTGTPPATGGWSIA